MNKPLLRPGDQKAFGPYGAGQMSSLGVSIALLALMAGIMMVGGAAIYFGFLWQGILILLFAVCVSALVLKTPISDWRMARRMKSRSGRQT